MSAKCSSRPDISQCIDVAFIKAREGFSDKGYVPKDKAGKPHANSGVTIGNGIDLKEKTRQYFENIGVPKPVIDKLAPYFGLKGQEAQDYLDKHPLVLTDPEARDLSNAVMKKSCSDVEEKYDAKISGGLKSFSGLSTAQRTVVCSVLFQYGNPTRVPRFWGLVTSQNWKGTISELRNFHDDFPTRRNLEADLLEKDPGTNSC